MDRACQVAKANDGMFRHKVGAAVVSVRRAGAIHTFDALNHFFLVNEMIVPGSSYWNIGIGREIGDVELDAEGIATMKTLGRNMAWLLENLKNPMSDPGIGRDRFSIAAGAHSTVRRGARQSRAGAGVPCTPARAPHLKQQRPRPPAGRPETSRRARTCCDRRR